MKQLSSAQRKTSFVQKIVIVFLFLMIKIPPFFY